MGRARITDNHGAGLYTIEIIEARERAESAKLQAESRITAYQAELVELETKISAAQDGINAAVIRQDDAVNQYQDDMLNTGSSDIQLNIYAEDVLKAVRSRDELIAKKRTNEIRTLSDQALVDRVNALPPLRQIQAWCADYVEDLSGDISTAEVPGEISNVIIKPSFDGNTWSAGGDGAMQPALASTPAGTFYNLAMLPGWQRWRPTFRSATISNIVGDTCTITLDPVASSQQGLSVNAQGSYTGVPVMYMDCDGEAFEDGDKVLVAFAGNINSPVVVGFESNPKQCISCEPYVVGTTTSWISEWQVKSLYENTQINVSPGNKWRICSADQTLIIASGDVVDDGQGGAVLSELPESVFTTQSEVQNSWYGCDGSNGNSLLEFSYTLPAPAPSFLGGIWSIGVEGGDITTDGRFWHRDFSMYITGDYYIKGDGTGCGYVYLTYYTPQIQLRLEVGCVQEGGSVVWPT